MTTKTKIYLRADGNSQIGLGHVHRLLALSEMLCDSFECIFLIHSPLPGVRDLIQKTCHRVIDIQSNNPIDNVCGLLEGNEIVVLDGYTFDTSYQEQIKNKGSKLVCIDDIHSYHFASDVLINPAGGVDISCYSMLPTTKFFSGPEFAIVKKDFLNASNKRSRPSEDNNLFICMGGADPDNNTLLVLKNCLLRSFQSYNIVIGEAFKHTTLLQEFIAASEHHNKINVFSNLDSASLAQLMKKNDIAVCSSSGIAYEYLCIRGELYVKQTAENQKLLFNFLTSNFLAFNFERFRVGESEAVGSIAKQREVFDGNSDKRILKIFNQLDLQLNCNIRSSVSSDLMMLFNWTNDPELRSRSYSTNQVTFEEHTHWFLKKLADPHAAIFILEYKGVPFAQVRFDKEKDVTISYSIAKEYRGKGWGQLVLEIAIDHFYQQDSLAAKLVAYVKKDNQASIRIFTKMGFDRLETDNFANSYRYEYKKYEKKHK